ncbi:MAG TPA: GNAT family N-acetyltransferase [Gammaproteobacteria bacterium]|nr:GNAT family N-acetyltransferase [Gammaproteobacteria bacterium]
MGPVELIAPRGDLEFSHRAFVEEFRERGEELVPWVLGEPSSDFAEYAARLNAAAKGIGLAPGLVPHSTFWLLDGAGEIVAVSNLRHALTDYLLEWGGHIGYGVRPSMRGKGYATEILRRTLKEAHAIDLRKVRIVCDKDNTASARVILRNGGQLDDEQPMPGQRRIVSRYWVSLR